MCETRPFSDAPSDAGPFDTAQLTRAFELDRDQAERDPTHRQKIRLAMKKAAIWHLKLAIVTLDTRPSDICECKEMPRLGYLNTFSFGQYDSQTVAI